MLQIFITDDHRQISDGLKTMLSESTEYKIVGIAQTGAQTISDLAKLQVDILILDIRLPDMTGKEVFEQLPKKHPKILISSMEKGIYFIRYFIEKKVEGYVLKEEGFDELKNALNTIAAGGTYFSKTVTETYQANRKKDFELLTRTETKIFCYKYNGLTNKEISEKCFISETTVEKHLANIFNKYFERDDIQTDKKASRFNLQKLIRLFNETGYIYQLTGQTP